jgi:threonine synthase
VVCVLTGHGLKDPQVALEEAGPVIPCAPDLPAVEEAVLG